MCLESTNIFGIMMSTDKIFVALLFFFIYSTKDTCCDRIVAICMYVLKGS